MAGLSTAVILLLVGVVVSFGGYTVAERNAARATALSAITTTFEDGLDERNWDVDHLAKLEQSVTELEQLDPAQAATARERLYERFAEVIGQRIRQPRLDPDDVDQVNELLALLESRVARTAAELRSSLEQRVSVWEQIIDLKPPFDNWQSVLDPRLVEVGKDKLISRFPQDVSAAPIINTKISSTGIVQFEATFDESWKTGAGIGLVLSQAESTDNQQGYSFTLTPVPQKKRDRHKLLPEQDQSSRLLKVLSGHTEAVWRVAFSPDGKTVVSASQDKTVRFWNVMTGKPISCHSLGAHSLFFMPGQETLAAVRFEADNTVALIDSETGLTKHIAVGRRTCQAAATGERNVFAFAERDTWNILLWDRQTNRITRELLGHKKPIESLAFSPNDEYLASGGADPFVIIWDVPTGKERFRLPHEGGAYRMAFSPDGRTLVTGARYGKVIRQLPIKSCAKR